MGNHCTQNTQTQAEPDDLLTFTREELRKVQSHKEQLERQLEKMERETEEKDKEKQKQEKLDKAFVIWLNDKENYCDSRDIDAKLLDLAERFEVDIEQSSFTKRIADLAKIRLEEKDQNEIFTGNFAALTQLKKFGKEGARGAKDKHVLFTHVNGKTILDWSDQELDEKRVIVKSISVDHTLVSKNRKLGKKEKDCILIVESEGGRNLCFMADSKEERDNLVNQFSNFVEGNN